MHSAGGQPICLLSALCPSVWSSNISYRTNLRVCQLRSTHVAEPHLQWDGSGELCLTSHPRAEGGTAPTAEPSVSTSHSAASVLCRDTYSDRSGSSSPDSEITELKFPSFNHD